MDWTLALAEEHFGVGDVQERQKKQACKTLYGSLAMVISSGTCAAADLDQVNSALASKQRTSVSTRRRSPVPEFCDSRTVVVVVPGDSSFVSAFTKGIAAGSKPVVESKSISSRQRTATLSSN
jgi:hypothetical protein